MAMHFDPVEDAFNSAKQAFRNSLADPNLYNEILTATTITDVYKLTSKLQEDAASQTKLRHLARIRPFLERLSAYAGVIDTFIQVKPDLLALIWGPIRLIILLSSQLTQALDAIADAMGQIAQVLPQFASMTNTFAQNDAIKAALGVFYQDILDFYTIILKFFCMSRWKYMFESIWPNQKKKIDVVVGNLKSHAHLMREEVTLVDIKEAQEARIRALAHFTETHEFQETQKFQGFKARINPPLYDERLDWLCNRSHIDGAKWLLRDQTFTHWLEISKRDSIWLWLQGIPGAGKTFLAAAAIQHAKKNHRTIFVFASHANQNGLTALSVIQSLIFQAVINDKNLQTVLVESSERDLKSNTLYASDLLKSLVVSAGPTYIVIDGLDEIEESERQILLQKLETIVKDCDELKILICSRTEDDITKALGQKAKSIRVDQKNLGSIQGYINTRSQEWMDNCNFDSETESEVRSLLSPLSAHAKGMFLYARIVLDNLEQLHGIDEVRRELKALPIDLTDAYHRIFQRINDSRPQIRDKCRRILAWIGCAPIPLTTFELEQVLLVDGSTEGAPLVATPVNFVRMCGPIIEIVNERPQFVHFTVKEFFFSIDIKDFIETEEANLDMAKTSLSYLCSRALDPELSSADLEMNLISGRYRLLGYFAFHWSALTLPIIRQIGYNFNFRFSNLLTQVAVDAKNYEFDDDIGSLDSPFKNEELERISPEGYEMLCSVFKFHLDERSADWNLDNGETWVNLDPLTTSQILVKVQERFDALLCGELEHGPGCNEKCAALQRHYGSRLYKCTYPSCSHSRLGFKSRSDRDKHVKHHGRPWKCSVAACEWSVIGFNTKKSRDDHWLRFHQTAAPTETSKFDDLDGDDIQPLLFGLVKDGDVDGVQSLLASSGGARLGPEIITAARIVAVQQGSLPLAQLLTPKDEKHVPANLVLVAVEGGDADIVRWTLSKSDPDDVAKFIKAMLDTSSDHIYSLWEEHLVKIPRHQRRKNSFDDREDRLDVVFKQPVFSEVKDDPVKEARLKHTWRVLSELWIPDAFSAALIRVAKSTCSIPLARELIELGADLDYPTKEYTNNGGMTALRLAAKKITKDAALFMQFLLSQGASDTEDRDRRIGCDTVRIGNERGAKEISKWLGVTWEELVKSHHIVRINRVRKKNGHPLCTAEEIALFTRESTAS